MANKRPPGPALKPVSWKLACLLIAVGCGLMAGPPLVTATVPRLSGSWVINIPFGIGTLLFINGAASIWRARRLKQREEVQR